MVGATSRGHSMRREIFTEANAATASESGAAEMTKSTISRAPAPGSAISRLRPARVPGSVAVRVRYVWRSYWEWRTRRATVLLLQSLDARSLEDIGLTPDEVDFLVADLSVATLHRSRLRAS
jgi:uncharacterized protein YjiS (DUF1127 family)